ncbi:MAG: hypothetical protein ABJP52_06545 [Flavobacteriaceae bacterium]
MQEFKKLFGLFLFMTLMLVKVSSLHVYSHGDCDEDEIENCTVCDLAIEAQGSSFVQLVQPEVTFQPFFNFHKPHFDLVIIDKTSDLSFDLFSRPPPTLFS